MNKIGKYQILEILGQGAMGIVYKAVDPDIDREVAIKTINFGPQIEDGDEEIVKRFGREARAAGKLTHPNIVTIYEVGRAGDMTFIVMQYVEGKSLQQLIAEKKKFTDEEILCLFSQICSGLDAAHRKGIVHRDIKPGNILIDREGNAHIVDFGVARVETSTMTTTGTTLGTPSYMSPEQVMGKMVDSRSDLFSLGVVLYEILTGERPFRAENVTTLIYKIINEKPPAMSSIRENIPLNYEHVVNKALAKNPDDRYQSCFELAQDLTAKQECYEPTLQMDTSSLKLKRHPGKGRKIALFLVGGAMIVIALGAAYLFLLDGKQKNQSSLESNQPAEVVELKTEKPDLAGSQQAPKVEKSEPEKPPANEIPSGLQIALNDLENMLAEGKYAAAKEQAEKLLIDNPGHSGLLDVVEKSKRGLNAEEVAKKIKNGIESYNKGDYTLTISLMQEVLSMDSNNREARRYIGMSEQGMSKADILKLLERQEISEESKNLTALLQDMGNSDVSEKRREAATLLFNYYDNIESVISDVSIEFKDNLHASVNFSNLVTAVYKKTNQKTVVTEGRKTWEVEKQGDSWKIVSLK